MNNNIRIKTIKKWYSEFGWLNNSYETPIPYGGRIFPTLTHAFEASRTWDSELKGKICTAKIEDIATLLKTSKTPNHNFSAVSTMNDLLLIKFGLYPKSSYEMPMFLFKKLAATGDARLIYQNLHHDNFFGDCKCNHKETDCNKPGKNLLGFNMESIRQRIHDKIAFVNPTKTLCHCGNPAVKRILYSTEWAPYLAFTCEDPECIGVAVIEATKKSSDNYILEYSHDKSSPITYLMPKQSKAKVVTETKTNDQDDLTDDEIAEQFAYGMLGGWSELMHTSRNTSTTSVTTYEAPPEREYKTTVVQC